MFKLVQKKYNFFVIKSNYCHGSQCTYICAIFSNLTYFYLSSDKYSKIVINWTDMSSNTIIANERYSRNTLL